MATILRGSDNLDSSTITELADFIGANQSLTSSGYQKLPGGLIIQWGSVTIPASSSATVSLPTTFPTGVLSYAIVPSGNNTSGELDYGVSITTSQITLATAYSAGDSSPKYIAIGC